MAYDELIRIPSNDTSDAKGVAGMLEGDLFIYVVAGALLSLAFVYLFVFAFGLDMIVGGFLATSPLSATLIYVFMFRNGKPPHYQDDMIEGMLGRKSYELKSKARLNPFYLATMEQFENDIVDQPTSFPTPSQSNEYETIRR